MPDLFAQKVILKIKFEFLPEKPSKVILKAKMNDLQTVRSGQGN